MENQKLALIIDDEAHILSLLSDTLKSKGFKTITARNGQKGLELFEKHSPDLVITDVMLPRIDGMSLVKKFREHPHGKNLPIIVISAVFKDYEYQNKAIKDFNVDYLVKPFTLTRMMKVLKKHRFQIDSTSRH